MSKICLFTSCFSCVTSCKSRVAHASGKDEFLPVVSSALAEITGVAALAQLGDAQFNRSGARLPDAVAVAVTLGKPIGGLLAVAGARKGPDLQLHEPLGGKADHLAQQIGVGGLLHKRAQVHHLVGHRWFLELGWCSQPDPTGELSMTTAKPLARYSAMGARSRAASLSPSYTITGDTTITRSTSTGPIPVWIVRSGP